MPDDESKTVSGVKSEPSEPMFRFTITLECACGNAARYLNERGQFCCATCPIKEGIDAIKLVDVPKLLEWARKFDNLHRDHPWHQSLVDIIQQRPKPRT